MPDNLLSTPPHPEKTIQYFTGVGDRKELVRQYRDFNPEFPIEPKYRYLHSLLREKDFFREALEAFDEEIEFIIEELIHQKMIRYNSLFYLNDQEYDDRMQGIGQLLNHDPDYFLVPYLFQNKDREIEWKRFDTNSTYFMHRFRNSYTAYKFLFSRIWRHGGIYLEVYYPEGQGTGILNELTDKAVRLVDNSSVMADWLPPIGSWPEVGYITGLESYNQFARLYAFRFDDRSRPEWDTGAETGEDIEALFQDSNPPGYEGSSPGDYSEHEDYQTGQGIIYEENNLLGRPVDFDPEYFFDTQNFPWVRDRTVILSMTADRVLNLQENSLRTDPVDCLQDIPFLQYVRRQALIHKKIVERVKVGTQLTLACDTTGFYVKSGDSAHTMPTIKADVTVLPNNYEENSEPVRLRLGIGKPNEATRARLFRRPGSFQKLAKFGDVSVYDFSTYMGPDADIGDPADLESIEQIEQDAQAVSVDDFRMVRPIFSTVIGEFEKINVTAAVTAINTMVERQRLQGGGLNITLFSPELVNDIDDLETTVIPFPHEFISAGSFSSIVRLDSFFIRIAATMIPADQASLTLTLKELPLKAFLFNLRAQEAEFDIVPLLLYDAETLRTFGSSYDPVNPEDPPADPNDGWAELIGRIASDNYQWPFYDLAAPDLVDTLGTLGEYLMTLDPLDPNTDIHNEILLYLQNGDTTLTLGDTSQYEYVQDWLEEKRWFEFYPVQDYDANGEALPLPEDDYLSDAKVNWLGTGWQRGSWYRYVPQFIWQTYARIVDSVNAATGDRTPEVEYLIYNELTFREALRFIGRADEITETTTSEDYTTREGILEEFFLASDQEGVYGYTPRNEEDPFYSNIQTDHLSFFDPMFTGGLSNIPTIVLHNHARIDSTFQYLEEPPPGVDAPALLKEGVRLDLINGVLEFRIALFDDLPQFQSGDPGISNSRIDNRALRENGTREARLTYTVNTVSDVGDSDDVSTRIVGITEAGIFNTEDKLIAYATFPPVIYDSFENHLAINWYISDTQFVAP